MNYFTTHAVVLW